MDGDLVYIEKLVCKGFKSFGRETITMRMSPGFTCIVGPNGSGKSNVIDAILFVLGQLSAKTLRANVFSDLLYSPPKPDMPPKASSAIVELHFNNKDRRLQVDTDKVVIERELDESGKSTCRVNGKVVTRTNVLDLLGGIGVDPNGYNLVLQGEIAQMIKVSPIDRRKLIEEIAGISAYDEQKEKAMKKLSESEKNLAKVETQLQERRRQLEKLQGERNDALRYRDTESQIRDLRVDILAWTLIKSHSRMDTISETLAQKAEETEKLVREYQETEQSIDEMERIIEAIDDEIETITGGDSARISEKYGVLSSDTEHVRGDLERIRAEYERAIGEQRNLMDQLEDVGRSISLSKAEIDGKATELDELDKEIQKCELQISNLETTLEKEQDDYYETQQRLQDLNNQMISMDEAVSDVRSAIKSNEKELGLAYEEYRDSKDGLERTEEELDEIHRSLPDRQKNLREAEEKEAQIQSELDDILIRLQTVDAEVAETAKIVNATREELIKSRARQDALKEAEEAFLRRRRAVARILELRDNHSIPGIYGTVAELGVIDSEYALALEIAGGNRLAYVVVEDDNVATQCINLLREERVGRASFIPLNRIKSKRPGHIPDNERVIGYAMDLVTFEPKFKPAFEFVFSDTIVTEDFETCKKMGFRGWRAVSLEGDLVERSGLITGGHYTREGSGLSLQIEDTSSEITSKLKGLEEIHNELRERQDQLYNRKTELEKSLQIMSKENYREKLELESLELKLEEKEKRKESLEKKIQMLEVSIGALEEQINELRVRDQELTAHREDVRQRRDRCNEALAKSDSAKINQNLRDLKEVSDHLRKKRDSLQSEITSLQVALAERLEPKSVELEHRIQSMNAVVPGLESEVTRLEESLTKKEKSLLELKHRREEIEDTVKDKRVHQLRLKEDLRNLRLQHDELREAQTSNEKSIYRLHMEQSRLEEDLIGIKAELRELADIDNEIQKRKGLQELTYREIEELQEKSKELERELNAMGAVNLKSLTDYDLESEKYEEIADKKTKLENEHKDILEFMEELEREKTRKFLQVYNEIADNFAKIFAKLSPGGEANLMLENPEYPLMEGITVRSKPAGKELISLDSMSGGEKTLTGLALIFAIQMYSPASFYVFDEIDAALDDVNTHNVALLISEMSKSSQFIVVSLKEVTVRKADLVIGVSNQDGISKIVAVDLEEVAASA